MPSLSEFVSFIGENSGVKNPELIEKDIREKVISHWVCSFAA